jgi:hydroxymethylbilane synthase
VAAIGQEQDHVIVRFDHRVVVRHDDVVAAHDRADGRAFRLRKLGEGVAEATFLACAGLRRLGRADLIRTALDPAEMLPAVAQGVIGVESRADDAAAAVLLEPIHDASTGIRLAAERAFLAALDGSCRTPIGGLAEIDGGALWFRGEIIRPDGSESLTAERRGVLSEAAAMGSDAASELRKRAGPGFFDA